MRPGCPGGCMPQAGESDGAHGAQGHLWAVLHMLERRKLAGFRLQSWPTPLVTRAIEASPSLDPGASSLSFFSLAQTLNLGRAS